MSGLEYEYGGQWFDDMGALSLALGDGGTMGVDLANSVLDRANTNNLAKNMLGSGVTPYYDDGGVTEGA